MVVRLASWVFLGVLMLAPHAAAQSPDDADVVRLDHLIEEAAHSGPPAVNAIGLTVGLAQVGAGAVVFGVVDQTVYRDTVGATLITFGSLMTLAYFASFFAPSPMKEFAERYTPYFRNPNVPARQRVDAGVAGLRVMVEREKKKRPPLGLSVATLVLTLPLIVLVPFVAQYADTEAEQGGLGFVTGMLPFLLYFSASRIVAYYSPGPAGTALEKWEQRSPRSQLMALPSGLGIAF